MFFKLAVLFREYYPYWNYMGPGLRRDDGPKEAVLAFVIYIKIRQCGACVKPLLMYNLECRIKGAGMNRRSFLKVFGIGLVASLGTRAAQARVCIREPRPFATPAELAALQTRIAALETANNRVVGTATAGPLFTMLRQAVQRNGSIVTVNILTRAESRFRENDVIVTLPVGFRPNMIIPIDLTRMNEATNSPSNSLIASAELRTNGQIICISNGGVGANTNISPTWAMNFAFFLT